jgi:UDP-N-acetylmuramoyl-L-alanyl-D-glutamate--2,6-diaminopimelate ligase
VVVEQACPEAGRLQVVVRDSRSAHSKISHALAGNPATRVCPLGVTGRRGKGATALFLKSIFEAAGESVGAIGRSGWSDGVSNRPAGPESPGSEGFASMMAAMVDRGTETAILELDDKTLDRREVDGVAFEAAVITNLAALNLARNDSETLNARRRSFARLAKLVCAGGAVIINADEPDADPLGSVNLNARRVTFGIDRPAHVSATIERHDSTGSTFRLRGFDREATVTLRLGGEEHVGHALAASAVAWSRGIPIRAVIDGLESVSRLPGRLEPVEEGQDFEVRIDGAKTAPELLEALSSLRGLISGRLICVIGAEGGSPRQSLRRAGLARAAELAADRVIATTNNPRGEDPDRILDDLLAGCRNPGRIQVEPDRRTAIARALAEAQPGDAVLITGKGRQTYQILNDRIFPFDDAEIAAGWLRANRVATRRSSA